MAGKKLDRVHAQTALETVRENPGIALIAAAPALVVFAVVWWLAGFGTALRRHRTNHRPLPSLGAGWT